MAAVVMNMSRIYNCDQPRDCKPWKAPNFEAVEDSNVDYQLPRSQQLSPNEKKSIVRQQAFEKSYARGYMEGLEQGKKETRSQIEHLHSLMAALSMPLPGLDDHVVEELAELSMMIVKQMVRRELKSSPDEVIAVVKEAVSMLPATPGEVRIELHPEDAVLVKHILGEEADTHWIIIDDPVITRGGCKVSTAVSRIDATLENRINTAIATVMGSDRVDQS